MQLSTFPLICNAQVCIRDMQYCPLQSERGDLSPVFVQMDNTSVTNDLVMVTRVTIDT